MRYYQTDALGSVIALTDESGAIKTQYTYDPFGNTTVLGEQSDNPFQYTGRENDGTGLYYYRARYYSAELQRFISTDPLNLKTVIFLKQSSSARIRDFADIIFSYAQTYPQVFNEYAYVINNPVNWIDPYGLIPYITKKGWAGVIIGGAGTALIAASLVVTIPFAATIGLSAVAIGGVLVLWDIYEIPETIDKFDKKLDPVRDATGELQKELGEDCD